MSAGPTTPSTGFPTAAQWREAINAGHYTHVVTTFDPYLPGTMRQLAGGPLDSV